MPDEIYGSSDILDEKCRNSLNKQGNPSFTVNFSMNPLPNQAVNANLENCRIAADINCIPVEAPNRAGQSGPEGQQIALPSQIDKDLNTMIQTGAIAPANA